MSNAYRRPYSRDSRIWLSAAVAGLAAVAAIGGGGVVRSQPSVAPVMAAQPEMRDDQAQLILRTLADAESQGFKPGEFATADADALIRSGDPAARMRGQTMLQRAVIAYAKAQHGGRIHDFPDEWGLTPVAYDAEADFNFALKQDRLAPWLASLPPPFERYRALRTALAQYRGVAARGGWDPIDAGPSLKPGMTDPRVIQLRKRIAAENPPGSIDVTSPVYDPQFAAVVAAAQTRYGLGGDGVVGATTLRIFNVPVEGRIAEIAANLERWRWMPRAWPVTRVEVNIAGAQLAVYDQNKVIDEMKVVVGAPDKKTPMLMSQIHSVVFNPPWNVPSKIAAKELLPKGADYLARKGFVVLDNGRLQQKPGPGNSLGRIKFDFNNPYGVYLHDTNAKTAFGRDARSISHGCVRVERPEELANILLGTDTRWSPDKLDEVLADTTTVRASLAVKVPVMLLYWTVFTSADGQVNFRDDIYDWDDQVQALLGGGKLAA